MTSTSRFFSLLALPLLAAGCDAGAPALAPAGAESDPAAPAPLAEVVTIDALESTEPGLRPSVEEFVVQPTSLPLGGGPVRVTWAASDVSGCALLADDEPLELGAAGELEINLEDSTEFRLVCLDEDQEVVADASREVSVLAPPTPDFSPDEELVVAAWETGELSGEFDEAGEVYEVAVSLDEVSILTALVVPGEERDGIELWLASDANGDGLVQPDEVISYGWGSEVRLDEELPAGDYSLFVVSRSDRTTWDLEVFVAEPGPDGSNW